MSPEESAKARRLADVMHGVRLACIEVLTSPDGNPARVARELSNDVRDPARPPVWLSLPEEEFGQIGEVL